MVTALKKPLYTAEASVKGRARLARAIVRWHLGPRHPAPGRDGGAGGGTNPEQLFALGYSACFQSAMSVVAPAGWAPIPATPRSPGRVTIGTIGGGGFGLAVELDVHIPGVDEDTADKIVHAADQVCPYSNATRDNIEVTLKLV